MNINKSEFFIKKMDCPSEANMIRMNPDEIKSIEKLEFDMPSRTLKVFRTDNLKKIEKLIQG